VLTSLEVRNVGGDLLTLPLGDDSSGFIIQDIEGLEPVKATLVSSSFANMDGAQYHTSRREPRNLKLKFEIEPDYILDSVAELRKQLYNFFMPKTRPNLRFVDSGGLVVGINGRVESFDSPLFTKDPTADISLMCYDPDFVDIDSTLISGSTTSGTDETLIEYDGTVETGFVFSLHVDRALTDFTIYHRPPDDVVRTLDFTGTLGAGDELVVSTIAGSKGATLISGSTETSVLYGVSPQSNWIELQPGANYIRVYATGAAIPFDIEYNTRYGGL
jgi:hypothetical protein